jgi:2-dehydropantoate 2-reductase
VRIAVMGAGGIGSYLGALLAASGNDVVLICRGAHLAAIRARGLKLIRPAGELTVEPISATDDPATVAPVDVVIQAVKMYDLASSTRQMLPMVGPQTIVVPIQNGVSAPEEIGAIVGSQRVIGGLVFINCIVAAPGVAHSKSSVNAFIFGELDGAITQRVMALRETCVAAGIDARASDAIRAEQWRKFLPVAGLSALGCLSRQPIGPIRSEPRLRALYRQAMNEVVALGVAKGISFEPDVVDQMLALAEKYQPDAKVSMLEDLEAGKPLELDWLSGYVSNEARRLGMPAPFHDMAYTCLKPLDRRA